MAQRRKAFRSHSEEYAKILDVVGRCAVHCEGVAFSCKKHGDSAMGISVPSNASTVDRIRQIHGSSVANELIDFDVSDDKWGFKASGWTSNANYHVKKTAILLFINHRSVESSAIKKAIEQTYSTFLPKGGHPFVYLSLDIDPHRVDVNVHPTKREVNFLNEDEIIETICDTIRLKLAQVDTSRTFLTQSLLPGSKIPTTASAPSATSSAPPASTRRAPNASTPKPHENNLVRTDSKLRKITSMLPSAPVQAPTDDTQYTHSDHRARTPCRLTTIKDLRAAVRAAMHASLTETLASHTYVGVVDFRRRIAAVQSGVKLFLVDYGLLCNEYFYQVGLTDFGNFGSLRFHPPLSVGGLLAVAVAQERAAKAEAEAEADADADAEDADEGVDWAEVPALVQARLVERREMLSEYFSLEISAEGELVGLPLLVKGYTPSMAKLPRFLMRLGPCVEWEDERGCFHTFLRELAAFYTVEGLPNPSSEREGEKGGLEGGNGDDGGGEDEEIGARRERVGWVLEHVLFPAFRARLVATRGMLRGVVECANLKGLYRVFERC